MMKRWMSRGLFATAGLILAFLVPSAVGAHGDGGASWGKVHSLDYSAADFWTGTVEDTADDGQCVSLWTIDQNGNNLGMMAYACYGEGPQTGFGVPGGGAEDAHGVRMWLGTDGYYRYSTIVHP